MGVREGQGMAFEFLAPRTALEKPFSLRGRIFHGLPQRSIGKTGVTFLASATRIQSAAWPVLFPAPISLGVRAIGWVEAEIEAWLSQQIERSRRADLPQHRAT